MRGLIYSILLFFAVLATACDRPHEVVVEQGSGTLVVTIGSAEIIGVEESRAELGDGDIADGGGMHDLTLILVYPHNTVVDKKSFSYDGTKWSGDVIKSFDANKQITTSFEGLDIAHYDIYAYANIEGRTDTYRTIAEQIEAVTVGSKFTLADATLPNLTDIATPEKNDTMPMLLTASKRIPISIGATSTSVELQRIMAHVELIVVNNSNKTVRINSLEFRDINPESAYLTPHDEMLASGANNLYRSLPDVSGPVEIAGMSEKQIFDSYVLESTGDKSLYQFDVNIGIDANHMISVVKFDDIAINQNDLVAGNIYVLKNTSGDYYLANNNGNLTLYNSITESNYQNAEWILYNQGYLENPLTGNKFYRSTQAQNSGDALTFENRGSGVYRIYYSARSGWNTYTYYLRRNNNNVEFSRTDSNNVWQLYTVKTRIDNVNGGAIESKQITEQISTLDDSSVAVPMTEIRRNSHITIVLNVYYDEVTGGFRFEVEPWNPVDVELEFN